MKVEEIYDYAYPCMMAEKFLKETHFFMSDKNHLFALKCLAEVARQVDQAKLMIKKMEEKDASITTQSNQANA